MVDIDEFVGRSGISAFPFGDVRRVGDLLARRVEAHDFDKSTTGHDVSFEEGIGGEAVRTMEAGAGHFTDGEESPHGGFSTEVSHYATTLIVCRGDNGDGFLKRVVAERKKGFVNEGKALGEGFAQG